VAAAASASDPDHRAFDTCGAAVAHQRPLRGEQRQKRTHALRRDICAAAAAITRGWCAAALGALICATSAAHDRALPAWREVEAA
jgi:hypothetical protein